MSDWKRGVLGKLGLDCMELTPEDWVLALLYVDGKSRLMGEASLHTIFFLYPYPSFKFTTLLVTVYSEELHRVLNDLINRGLVRKKIEYINGRLVDTYFLTERGSAAAAGLVNEMTRRWVMLDGFIVREGRRILEELESLKRTYNGRSPRMLLKVILDKIRNEEPAMGLRLEEGALTYLKALIQGMERDFFY